MPTKNAPAGAPVKITAAHIRRGLRIHYPHPECGIVFEVAEATAQLGLRHLDAIAMDTWPSRGLCLHGIEIKVSLSDFRREKADPSKAEALAKFCDKFWIAAPPGLIPVDQLPDAWGLLEGGADGMRVKKPAMKTPALPADRDFLAGIFRAAGRSIDLDDQELALSKLAEKLRGEHAEEVRREAERLSTNNSEDAQNWRALMTALGLDTSSKFAHVYSYDAERWIRVIKAVHAAGVMEAYNGLYALQAAVKEAAASVDRGVDALGLPPSDEQVGAMALLTQRLKKRKAR